MSDVQSQPANTRSPWASRTLFGWLFGPLAIATFAAAIVAAVYVVTSPQLLKFEMMSITPFFILVHCIAIVAIQGRTRSSAFAFLYSQGFERRTLWNHTMLASFASALIVWLPAAFLIWTGIRSFVQDANANFLFPLMAVTENAYPLWCLLMYAVLIPVFHYVWIREAQGTRGASNGLLLAIGLVLTGFSIWNSVRMEWMPIWTVALIVSGLSLAAIALLIASRVLHRRMEVLS